MANNIDESKVIEAIEFNKKYPNNPYNATIESDVINKSDEENISTAKKIMNQLNRNYNESIQLYNKIEKELSDGLNKLKSDEHYQNSNGERQSYFREDVYRNVLKSNGLVGTEQNLYDKDIPKLYAIKNINNILSNEIEQYQPNTNVQETTINKNDSVIENENTKIQKLKSVELEKNIIGLLPKEEQQNNFKETLSRLEKNKSDLVSHLKEQLGINKVNDIIKSVKDNFENIKVKAEDIHQTFKDLGNWNTNNNFVKNIDNVVVSIKELGKKHENELLQSDSKSIMNKLSKEYNELKNFVNKAENEDKIYNQKNEVRNNFIKETLKLNGVNTKVNSQELLENLSDNQKTGLYNYLKDTNSHYKNLSTDSSMEKEYQNNVLIKEIEKQMPEVIKHREEYLATNPKIQTLNFDNSNDKIKEFIDNRNSDIKNMSKNDRTNSTVNQKQELNISKQNNKSNQIKNNDMFKKMNRIEAEDLEKTQNETKKESKSIVR
jgi:hypothetical protein